jgi:UDP-N-acetylmuramate: L-alanyl-gamma-D-glutamyl-meso-diaminopimelate ligase
VGLDGVGWDAAAALAPLGEKAVVEDDLERLVERVVSHAGAGDYILVMSNGGFGGIHDKLLAALRARAALRQSVQEVIGEQCGEE